ncbi:perlucin-like [Argopecten irradians]|uniref:perlucin-like n=1 Tax=Argopecten irradians TaxID=31199 RepID=UPI003723F99F
MVVSVVILLLLANVHFSHGGCPEGYHAAGHLCLFFSEITGTWAEANSYCRTFSASLFEPNSDERQKAVVTALQTVPAPSHGEFFIGGSDFFVEGHWIWSTESVPVTNSHWLPGNPSDSNIGEDCMAVSAGGQWNDIACDRHLPFICETEPWGDVDIIG